MSRYADRLLADGERIVLRSRQHPIAVVVSVWFWVLSAVAVIFFLLGRLVAWAPIDWLALFGLLGALASLAWRTLAWRFQDYLVTDRRVVEVGGSPIGRPRIARSGRVDDAVLRQGILGRVLGYGDLALLTEGDASVQGFRMLAHPTDFKRAMLDAKFALERETGDRTPGPALRAPLTVGSGPGPGR